MRCFEFSLFKEKRTFEIGDLHAHKGLLLQERFARGNIENSAHSIHRKSQSGEASVDVGGTKLGKAAKRQPRSGGRFGFTVFKKKHRAVTFKHRDLIAGDICSSAVWRCDGGSRR